MADSRLDRVAKFYDEQAVKNPQHAAVLGEPSSFATDYREHQELKTFSSLVALKSSDSFLEFGSGGGRWLEWIAPRVQRAVGVELSTVCCEISRKRLRRWPNVTIDQTSLQDYRVQGSFDWIYYSGVLLYLDDHEVENSVASHLRSLSVGGNIIIRDSLSLTASHTLTHSQGFQATYRTLAFWNDLFTEFGFALTAQRISVEKQLPLCIKRSYWLRARYLLSRWAGMSSSFLDQVAIQHGVSLSHSMDWADYTHDFLLFEKRNDDQ